MRAPLSRDPLSSPSSHSRSPTYLGPTCMRKQTRSIDNTRHFLETRLVENGRLRRERNTYGMPCSTVFITTTFVTTYVPICFVRSNTHVSPFPHCFGMHKREKSKYSIYLRGRVETKVSEVKTHSEFCKSSIPVQCRTHRIFSTNCLFGQSAYRKFARIFESQVLNISWSIRA